jgi:hypothetical protein
MMRHPIHILLGLVALASLGLVSPVSLRAWAWRASSLQPLPLPAGLRTVPPQLRADLNLDGLPEDLQLEGDRLSIISDGQVRWSSPAGWQVRQAQVADLNHDTVPEAVLLVWRAFRAWPVDAWLPSGGRISAFHDSRGLSAQIILIGWKDPSFGELWAGSALAQPVVSFDVAALSGKGDLLLTLEGKYDDPPSALARSFKLWEWNGFGFGIVSALDGPFREMAVAQAGDLPVLVLVP